MPGAGWCGVVHVVHWPTGVSKVQGPAQGVQRRLILCGAACRTSRRKYSRSQEPNSNPHSVCARNVNMGEFRGFLHRGLCDTCPQARCDRRVGSRSGQVSHNPKQQLHCPHAPESSHQMILRLLWGFMSTSHCRPMAVTSGMPMLTSKLSCAARLL